MPTSNNSCERELLFKSDIDWKNNAWIHHYFDNMSVSADGYKLGADKLVEYIKANDNHQDTLLFPIIFLYMHAIELRLKVAIT